MCRTLITSPSCFVGISQVKFTKWHSIRKTTSGLGFDLRLRLKQGFNIAIMAAILLGVSRPIAGLRGSAWVALIGVALYLVLVGADAAVVRAAIMGGLFISALRFIGRPTYDPAVLLTAFVALTSEPNAAAISIHRRYFAN